MDNIIHDILISLESFKDAKRAAMATTYYPTQSRIIGVTNPHIKIVVKELYLMTKEWDSRKKINLAIAMAKEGTFELQHAAYEYLELNKKTKKKLNAHDVNALNQRLDNWVVTDIYGTFILGYAWRENIITTDAVKGFLKSEDQFIRRTALAATIALNQKSRGGEGDAKRTLEICKEVIDDRADMVIKALSWSLRALSVRDREAVIDFMEAHAKRLPKRVIREVWNKLNTGLKN